MPTARNGNEDIAADVAHEGELDLITAGFAATAVAVKNALHFPDLSARINPGHPTKAEGSKDE